MSGILVQIDSLIKGILFFAVISTTGAVGGVPFLPIFRRGKVSTGGLINTYISCLLG